MMHLMLLGRGLSERGSVCPVCVWVWWPACQPASSALATWPRVRRSVRGLPACLPAPLSMQSNLMQVGWGAPPFYRRALAAPGAACPVVPPTQASHGVLQVGSLGWCKIISYTSGYSPPSLCINALIGRQRGLSYLCALWQEEARGARRRAAVEAAGSGAGGGGAEAGEAGRPLHAPPAGPCQGRRHAQDLQRQLAGGWVCVPSPHSSRTVYA